MVRTEASYTLRALKSVSYGPSDHLNSVVPQNTSFCSWLSPLTQVGICARANRPVFQARPRKNKSRAYIPGLQRSVSLKQLQFTEEAVLAFWAKLKGKSRSIYSGSPMRRAKS